MDAEAPAAEASALRRTEEMLAGRVRRFSSSRLTVNFIVTHESAFSSELTPKRGRRATISSYWESSEVFSLDSLWRLEDRQVKETPRHPSTAAHE